MRDAIIAGILVLVLVIGVGAGYFARSSLTGSTGKSDLTTDTSKSSSTSACPLLVGCGPYPTLKITGAMAQLGSYGPTICQTTNLTAVCPVYIVGGDSGKVMVNVTFRVQPGTYDGGAYVDFLVYSSAGHYVNFTSVPTCAYTSGPNYTSGLGCQVPSNGQVEFQFAFYASPSYGTFDQRWPDSVTVSMWQTCCFA